MVVVTAADAGEKAQKELATLGLVVVVVVVVLLLLVVVVHEAGSRTFRRLAEGLATPEYTIILLFWREDEASAQEHLKLTALVFETDVGLGVLHNSIVDNILTIWERGPDGCWHARPAFCWAA
eukprot:CAMPEP_0181449932 /NCGR_PEP_ID=MMETSP1110-20121109/27916_1 /TAXON_ID=174948 /ORGANISM="Symbiodinium sp., Strain CCMP421" /LENGTH=122 /DNA_ID=CAMNT_0023574139 /DNA_START=420 /DNA_END=785 /DNA_ORIENTATION=+